MTKPYYSVMSMEDINNLSWNGYNVVSTFSGAGGSCLGYRMAGYRVLWANEFIPIAQQNYKLNHPNSILDNRDIRDVLPDDILSAIGLGVGEIDIFDGSPPCTVFSTAGKMEKAWGTIEKYSGKEQRVDDLFFEYARLVKGTQPKVFIAENVSGLVKGKAKGYFKLILKELSDCGYNVRAKLLNAKYLGVPQNRERIIFIGTRKDLPISPIFPKPLKYSYTIKDALPHIEKWVKGYGIENPTRVVPTDIFTYETVGKSHVSGNGRSGDVFDNGVRRKLYIDELKKICGFPDDFQLVGSFNQQWARLGNSVPPVMMFHIAKTAQLHCLDKLVKG